MFKCDKCKKTSGIRKKQHKISTQTKDKDYVNPVIDDKGKQIYDKYGKKLEIISTGFEIVNEINVCGNCL